MAEGGAGMGRGGGDEAAMASWLGSRMSPEVAPRRKRQSNKATLECTRHHTSHVESPHGVS
jgi:hypothetical protein